MTIHYTHMGSDDDTTDLASVKAMPTIDKLPPYAWQDKEPYRDDVITLEVQSLYDIYFVHGGDEIIYFVER